MTARPLPVPPARGASAGPFALPSGTTVRFVLLIASVAAVTALAVNATATVVLNALNLEELQAYLDCVGRAGAEAARRRAEDPAVFVPDFESGCTDPRGTAGRLLPLAATGCLVLALAGVYLALPRWRSVRRGYRPLTGMPELSAYLTALLRETGVRARVAFLTEPLDPTVAALAFGRAGRRQVLLSGGLLALYGRDRPAFRAVVLHELAHIRNRDLDIGFLTLIVWRACGPPMLGAVALALFLAPTVADTVQLAALALFACQMGLLGVLVTLLTRAVLRSRELYADARVCEWEGSSDSLRRLFEVYGPRVAPDAPGPAATATAGRLALLRRVHPVPAQRLAALAAGRPPSLTGFWDMAAVGAAVAFLHDIIALGPAGGVSRSGPLPDAVAALLAALLLTGAAGTVVWRTVTDGAVPRLRAAGLGLGLGLCVSDLLGAHRVWVSLIPGVKGLSYALPYTALMCLAGWSLLRWLAALAEAWQPVLERARRPRLVLAAVLTASVAGLFGMLDFLLRLPALMIYAASFVAPAVPGAVLFVGGTAVLLSGRLSTVLFPLELTGALLPVLGYALARRPRGAPPATGFGPPVPTAGRAVRLGVPAGLGAGVLCLVLLFALEQWWLVFPPCGLAQLWAAARATRDHAPLRLARGMVAVLGCGTLALLTLIALPGAVMSCLPAGTACDLLPDTGQLRFVMLGVALTSGPAWLLFAAAVGVAGAVHRRQAGAPQPRVGRAPAPTHSSAAKAARSSSRRDR
ncbi:M48 family metalloprotease [Streptomyces sp. NPDC001389]|uniref:M48 family metalloprotease n=1 Tax=unclassified Streptomyces TaxID=2593676 RepID=UPI0036A5FC0F